MKKIIWTMAAVLLASCSSIEEEAPVTAAVPDEIQIEVGVAGQSSRAGYDSKNLDKVQLIIQNIHDDTYSYNTTVSKIGKTWYPAKKMIWDQARNTVTVAAFAPAKDGVGLSTFSVSVPAIYSSANDVKNADFLLMRKRVNPKTDLTEDNKLSIELRHTMAKLVIDLGGQEVSNLKVNGTVLNGSCNLGKDDVLVEPNGSSTASITPFKNSDGTYECLIIPQDAENFTVTFKAGDRKYRWTANGATTFEANNIYTLPISVSNAGKVKGRMEACAR